MSKAYSIRGIDPNIYTKAKAEAALNNQKIGEWISDAMALKLNLYEDYFDENCEWQGRLIKCPDAWFLIVINEEDIESLVEKVEIPDAIKPLMWIDISDDFDKAVRNLLMSIFKVYEKEIKATSYPAMTWMSIACVSAGYPIEP